MFKSKHMKIMVPIVAISLILLAVFMGYGIEKGHIYLLPDGYTGWVEVRYEQKDSPSLVCKGNSYVYSKPETGILNTSSSAVSGGMLLYYLDNQGNRTRIGEFEQMMPSQSIGSHGVKRLDGSVEVLPTVNSFFVGTEKQWNDYQKKQ